MASKNEKYLNFDDILKRGSATEPRNFRPTPFLPGNKEDLSLNGEVKKSSKFGKKTNLPLVRLLFNLFFKITLNTCSLMIKITLLLLIFAVLLFLFHVFF